MAATAVAAAVIAEWLLLEPQRFFVVVFFNPPTRTGPKKCTNRSLQYRKKK